LCNKTITVKAIREKSRREISKQLKLCEFHYLKAGFTIRIELIEISWGLQWISTDQYQIWLIAFGVNFSLREFN
jgi:hypothetical protein